MALPTWKRCKPRSRSRRSSSRRFRRNSGRRQCLRITSLGLAGPRDLASRELEASSERPGARANSEATRERFLWEGGEETLRQRAAVNAKDSHQRYP
jgi:hypothetical protein